MHSATQILVFQQWKLGFVKMFNDKPLLISVDRSLLSYCTVIAGNYSKDFFKFICFRTLLKLLYPGAPNCCLLHVRALTLGGNEEVKNSKVHGV